MSTEIRVVCDQYGTIQHHLHHWPKYTMEAAKQLVTDLTHRMEVRPESMGGMQRCGGWHVETREVSEWSSASSQ